MKLINALSVILLTSLLSAPLMAVELISQQTLAQRIADDNAPLIIDVRSEREFQAGHIPGALLVPHDQIDQHLELLASLTDREVVLYCQSNRRVGLVLDRFMDSGASEVRVLEGAWPGWQSRGQIALREAE
jgi:phage shock protein E